jgi:hypothetical protein
MSALIKTIEAVRINDDPLQGRPGVGRPATCHPPQHVKTTAFRIGDPVYATDRGIAVLLSKLRPAGFNVPVASCTRGE